MRYTLTLILTLGKRKRPAAYTQYWRDSKPLKPTNKSPLSLYLSYPPFFLLLPSAPENTWNRDLKEMWTAGYQNRSGDWKNKDAGQRGTELKMEKSAVCGLRPMHSLRPTTLTSTMSSANYLLHSLPIIRRIRGSHDFSEKKPDNSGTFCHQVWTSVIPSLVSTIVSLTMLILTVFKACVASISFYFF